MSDELSRAAGAPNFDMAVRFKNIHSKLYLDATNFGPMGTNVIQFTRNEGDNQKWNLLYRESDDTFAISPVYSDSLYLNVFGNSPEKNANIIVWGEGTPTRWKLEYDNELRAHRIVSEYGGFVMGIGVVKASTEPGAQTITWPKMTERINDRWIIETP